MRVLIAAIVTLCLAQQVQAVPNPRTNEVPVKVLLASSKIRAAESILIKVVLENNGSEDLKLRAHLGSLFGSVHFELRPKGDTEFVSVRTGMTGTVASSPPGVLMPGSRLVCYEVLFRLRRKFIFDRPGSYELRANVEVDGKTLVSEPVTIEVEGIPEQERNVIEGHAAFLDAYLNVVFCSCSDSFGADRGRSQQANEIQRGLTKGKLKDVLAVTALLQGIKDAENPDAKKKAITAYEAYRKQLDPVSAEAADLDLARMYDALDDLQSLRALLTRITEPTRLAKALRDRVERK